MNSLDQLETQSLVSMRSIMVRQIKNTGEESVYALHMGYPTDDLFDRIEFFSRMTSRIDAVLIARGVEY